MPWATVAITVTLMFPEIQLSPAKFADLSEVGRSPVLSLRQERSSVDPCMQISEVSFKVCRIGLPRRPVHPGGGVALEHEERLPEQIDAEVVKERGELLLLSFLLC
jgi:hypothetical protein